MGGVVSLQEISKSYETGKRRKVVIADLSMSASAGEILWVRGRSGSGKSTLLSIIGLLTLPDRGRVEVAGDDLRRIGSKRAADFRATKIGFIFQNHNLLPHLTAMANVMLPGRGTYAGVAERALTLLSRIGMADYADAVVGRLSGGQQQRVAVARALLNEPALVLADEPVTGLDSEAAESVLHELSSAARTGRSVIVASHEEIVGTIADRVFDMPGQVA